MPRPALALTSLFLFCCLAVVALPAQQAPPPAAAVETAAPPPAPAAETSATLVERLERARSRLRAIRTTLEPRERDEAALGRLPEIAKQVERLAAGKAHLEVANQPLRRLDLMRLQWEGLNKSLDAAGAPIEERAAEIEALREELKELREQWSARDAAGKVAGLPAELLAQVEALRATIAEVESLTDERSGQAFAALASVTELRTAVDARLDDVLAARQAARRRLFVQDSPSMWDALRAPREKVSVLRELRDSWSEDSRGFGVFLETYRRRVWIQFALWLGFSTVMLTLRRRSRRWTVAADDPALLNAVHIFSRPFSAALALTLTCTRLFYPGAPSVVFELNGLLAVIAVLRLVPAMVYRSMRPAVYGLAALFAMQRLHSLSVDETLLERMLLLLISALGLFGALWVSRLGGSASRRRDLGKWWTAARLGIRLSIVTFAGALAGNLVGALGLAELLTEATLISAYGAVGLFVWARVVEALIVVAVRAPRLAVSGIVARHGDLIRRRSIALVNLLALVGWAVGTLYLFRLLDPVGHGVARVLSTGVTVGNLTLSLGSVLSFVLALWISVMLSRLIRFILEEDVYPRVALQRGVPATLSMLVHYGILALGFLAAMAAAGFELSQFAIIVGALGVGIGFGLQNIVNNFISGLILVFERPIKIGDTIEVGQLTGEVRRIGIRSSTVRTYDGAEVIVPNGNLIAGEVINWTLSDRTRRLKIPVGVAYGTDPQQVLDLLIAVAGETDRVASQPEPQALFLGFGESSLDFELRVWTHEFDGWPRVVSAVTHRIHSALAEAGIEIPFPQRDLHVRDVAPDVRRALAGEPGARLESGEGGH